MGLFFIFLVVLFLLEFLIEIIDKNGRFLARTLTT